jgi:hypothetical protein
MPLQQTITIDETTYELRALTLDEAEEIFAQPQDAKQITRLVIAKGTGISPDALGELPWSHYRKLTDAALELNGMSAAALVTKSASA